MLPMFANILLMEIIISSCQIFDVPLFREFSVKVVSIAKRFPGSLAIKLFVFFTAISLVTTVSSIHKIQRRISKLGSPTAADHFILRTYILDAFLMGSSLFLLLVIRFLHDQLEKIHSLKIDLETLETKKNSIANNYLLLEKERYATIEKEQISAQMEIESLKDLVADLRNKMENLQLGSVQKDKAIKTAEANAIALQKQSEGLYLEYDRLLEENHNLRDQLAFLDFKASHSNTKKKA